MSSTRTLVWDLPLRVFHWALGLAVVGAFITVKLGLMEWHGRLGGLALALLLFRLVWGFVGSHTARFVHFVPSPARLFAYIRGQDGPPQPGHNPLGALSVLALLGVFLLQGLAGLGTTDEIAYDGPLVSQLSDAWVERAGQLHHLNEPVLIGLVALHLLAIAYYRFRRGRDLLSPMLTGYSEQLPSQACPQVEDSGARRLGALALFGVCGGLVWLVFEWA